jgi:hypothetical protein
MDGGTIVYELVLTNTSTTPATLKKVEVLDGSNTLKDLASYEGQGLLLCLRDDGQAGSRESDDRVQQHAALLD